MYTELTQDTVQLLAIFLHIPFRFSPQLFLCLRLQALSQRATPTKAKAQTAYRKVVLDGPELSKLPICKVEQHLVDLSVRLLFQLLIFIHVQCVFQHLFKDAGLCNPESALLRSAQASKQTFVISMLISLIV